ncbi:MAG: response regulator [Candidatus Omnitrophota bacterium]|jgi:two-component system alkaline phosphatase synthesis response regulator PhoP
MVNKNKVIVIEDDPGINKLITYNLRKEGFIVEQAFDGDEASERLKSEYFSIVILDIMLPGINGFDICKEIKESDNSYKSFIIVISARTSNQDKLYAHILGADCYLSKPFRVGTLIEVVKEVQTMQNKDFTVKLSK